MWPAGVFCVFVWQIAGSFDLQPTVITELRNAFNNLSNLALIPELMQTAECRRDCEIYRDAFFRHEMWAMEMFDANGQPSSGILKGNIQQKGSMRECIYSSPKTSRINGKFCFGKIYINPLHDSSSFTVVYDKIIGKILYRSEPYEDAILQATNTILHGLCVPSSCTTSELTFASRKILSVYNHSKFDLVIHFDNMKDQNCIVKEELISESSFSRFIKNFFTLSSVLVLAATFADFFLFQDTQHNTYTGVVIITRSFSLVQNWKVLFNAENENTCLPWLNGVRCILYFCMFVCHHTIRFIYFTVDRADVYENLYNPGMGSLIRNGLLALDYLVLLNGISHSYKLTKLVEQNKIASISKLIFYRYLRFLIVILAFLLFGLSVFLKNETMMLYTPKETKLNIWSIIFCYENFAGVDNMLFGPAHSFFTDLQLYIFGCILLMVMNKWQKKFKIFLVLIVLTLLFRSIFLYFKSNVTAFIMFGVTVDQFFNVWTHLYATPLCRLPFYLAGLALGYYSRQNIETPSLFRKIGWIVALYCVYTVAFCCYSFDKNYVYDNYDGAKISFIHSFCAIFAISWVLWDCHSTPPNKILNATAFVVLNRLTPYFSFLHFIVLFYHFGEKKVPFEANMIGFFGLDYLFFTLFLCVFIMLFVHLPMKNLWQCLTHRTGKNIAEN